jgi:hypothetical protein
VTRRGVSQLSECPFALGRSAVPYRRHLIASAHKPIPNEVLADYLTWLAKANGINESRLRALLKFRGKSIRAGLRTAIAMSDRAIAFALPELRVADDVTAYPELRKAQAESIGPRCPLCASRHGIRIAYPHVWSSHDNVICRTHDLWLNGTAFRLDPVRPVFKLVGASKADIVIAHRRHQRLIRNRCRPEIRQAIADAYLIVEQWNYWKPLESVEFRLAELEPDETRRGEGTACRNAAMYPEVVRLAAVLSEDEWRQRLLADSRADRAAALLDVFEVVLDGHVPYRGGEPLYEWRLRQLVRHDVQA